MASLDGFPPAMQPEGASSYDIRAKGPGESEFVTVVSGTVETMHEFTGLAAGTWSFVVIGGNVSGDGEASLPHNVTVA